VRRVVQITPTNHLLTALAIADLLTMVSYLPYAVYFYCITCVTCITCITCIIYLPYAVYFYCVTVPDPSYGHPAGWVVYLLFNIYFTITTHTAAMWLTVALAVFRYVVVCCQQALGARLCTLQRAKVPYQTGVDSTFRFIGRILLHVYIHRTTKSNSAAALNNNNNNNNV